MTGDLYQQQREEIKALTDRVDAQALELWFWRAVSLVLGGCVVLSMIFGWPRTLAGSEPVPAPTPAEMVTAAMEDAAFLHSAVRQDSFYLFMLHADEQEIGALNYCLNLVCSHNSIPQPFLEAVPASKHLARVNIKRLCPRRADYDRFRLLFETLAPQNFYFHSIDPDFDATDAATFKEHSITLTVPEYLFTDGKRYRAKRFPRFVPALHLVGMDGKGLDRYDALCDLLGTQTPIVRADQLVSLLMRTTNEGLYYEFAGIDRNPQGQTAKDAFLALGGVDLALVRKARSDERAGMWRRRLNGQPSSFEWFPSLAVRTSIGPGYSFWTEDFQQHRARAKVHPMYNLLDPKEAGGEGFGMKANGFNRFILVDGKGNILNVAPPDVASDWTVPIGHPTQVEVPHGCVRCHGPVAMYHPLENHVRLLVERKLNIYDDVASKEAIEETVERLAGLYMGDPAEALRMARLTHARAARMATGDAFSRDRVTEEACAALSAMFGSYYYEAMTPAKALLELGWLVDDEEYAAGFFDYVIPMEPLNDAGYRPESPAVASFRDWWPGTMATPKREDFEREYAVLATRALKHQLNIRHKELRNATSNRQLAP